MYRVRLMADEDEKRDSNSTAGPTLEARRAPRKLAALPERRVTGWSKIPGITGVALQGNAGERVSF